MRQILTERIFESSLDCMYKCRLLLNGRHGNKTEYEEHTDRFAAMYQRAAIARLQEMHPDRKTAYIHRVTPEALHSDRRQILIIRRLEVAGLRADSVVLARAENGRDSYHPVSFYRYEEINIRAKLLLAFRAVLVERATGISLRYGHIIYGHGFSRVRVPLSTFIAEAERLISRINELAIDEEPALVLCPHCEICEFDSRCRSRAIEEDNLSLIQGIGRRNVEEQARKGIFTLHQYSHTFRSRRLPKRVKNPSTPRHFALQARALRENKVYIHGHPTLPNAETSIYLDIEGIPARGCYYYIIGALIVTEYGELYRCFWANDKSEQPGIFSEFCDAVAAYPNSILFHFGTYEVKALKQMKECVGDLYSSSIDRTLGSCHNVLPVVHHHCYFPTYSNRLKDIAGFLGYQFDNEVRSGIRSILFRERWEETRDQALRDALITYNRQDCEALKTVCAFVRRGTALAATREHVPGKEAEVIPAESLRKVGDGNRPVFKKAEFVYPEFELANKFAYFDYQRDRVFARTQRLPTRPHLKRSRITQRRQSLATNVVQTPAKCPACGGKRLRCERRLVRWQTDLRFYKTKIGVKKWYPRYVVMDHRCIRCGEKFTLPATPFVADTRSHYGHGLMCWCVYQSIVGHQSMLSIHRGLRDIFDLNIPTKYVYQLRATLAAYYAEFSKEILSSALSSEVIHIDETSIKLRKSMGYVWVISSSHDVYYIFRDSREGSFLKDMLSTYQGILVSDFFTAYDSLKCRQQKCLVHLMRDINDDLRRNPYDHELRSIAEPFAKLLKEIVLAIDKYGLRRRHLHKYAKPAGKMCSAIAKQHFESPYALKYQSRFEKYHDRLFTFLDHDGVPWNNNNAEHAMHRFAKIRRISDGTFTRSSAERLLVLLSVLETCEYRNVNPLKFLLSGQRHLHELESCEYRSGTNFVKAFIGKETEFSGPKRHKPPRLRVQPKVLAERRYKRAVASHTAGLGERDTAPSEHKRRRPRIVSLNQLLPDIFEGFRSSFPHLRYRVILRSDLWPVRLAQIDLQHAMISFVYILRRETRKHPLILSAKNVRFGTPDPTLGLVGRYVAISLSDGGRAEGLQRPSREDPVPSGLEKELSLSQACISAGTLGGTASAKLVRTGRKSLTTIVTTFIPMYVPKPHAVIRALPHKAKPLLEGVPTKERPRAATTSLQRSYRV